jgi:isocitrate dehydrogenase
MTGNRQAKILADTLDKATEKLLETTKSPSPKTGEMDNRGSHFYLALYWSQAMAAQTDDKQLQARFATLAQVLTANEAKIVGELNGAQGRPVDIGGYYAPNPGMASKAMTPSATLNAALMEFR